MVTDRDSLREKYSRGYIECTPLCGMGGGPRVCGVRGEELCHLYSTEGNQGMAAVDSN